MQHTVSLPSAEWANPSLSYVSAEEFSQYGADYGKVLEAYESIVRPIIFKAQVTAGASRHRESENGLGDKRVEWDTGVCKSKWAVMFVVEFERRWRTRLCSRV